MSLYGVMRTSVSGMSAQSSKLSTVADNIANSSTTGYKRAAAEFSSLIIDSGTENYTSGGVSTRVRYSISEQGNISYTTSVTDLAVSGNGFMVVTNEDGTPFLTRAGSFVPDGDGNLVNAAGYYLMGFDYADGEPTPAAGSLTGLQVVSVKQTELEAIPSTEGTFAANLPSNAGIVAAADLPSANAATSTYTAKTSFVTYDSLGNAINLDVYFAKTADNTWELSVYDKADAAAGGGFPYGAAAIATETLTFDPTNGGLDAASPTELNFTVPGGEPLTLDISGMEQLAADYRVLDAAVNGNAPSAVERIEIDQDGTMYSLYENGARVATFKIPLADVPSPDNLTPRPGNIYAPSTDSGAVQLGFSTSGGLGTLVSGALESSTVDLASELTLMIESQRSYTANSKVFQTGSELLDVLVNLKR